MIHSINDLYYYSYRCIILLHVMDYQKPNPLKCIHALGKYIIIM